MKIANQEIIGLLGTLSCCMEKRRAMYEGRFEDTAENKMVKEPVEMFKSYLNTLSPVERRACLRELETYLEYPAL